MVKLIGPPPPGGSGLPVILLTYSAYLLSIPLIIKLFVSVSGMSFVFSYTILINSNTSDFPFNNKNINSSKFIYNKAIN